MVIAEGSRKALTFADHTGYDGRIKSIAMCRCQWVSLNFRDSPDSPALFQCSIPTRRTNTCSQPAAESISAALDERLSVRQMAIIGAARLPANSRSLSGSCVIGMLVAPQMWPRGPRNSSALRTSISEIFSPLRIQPLTMAGSMKRGPLIRRISRGEYPDENAEPYERFGCKRCDVQLLSRLRRHRLVIVANDFDLAVHDFHHFCADGLDPSSAGPRA